MNQGILIADDSATVRLVLRMSLIQEGFQVVGEAADGAEAVLLYEQLRPALVIMDIAMPGMNGIQAIKSLRKLDPRARVLICSSYALTSANMLVKEALKVGAIGAVPKNLDDLATLVAEVRRILPTP